MPVEESGTYKVVIAAPARRDLSNRLPEHVATAVLELIAGAIAENPQRVGKPLDEPYEGLHSARRGTYRVIYEIDETARVVTVVAVDHRGSAYRPTGRRR